MRAMLKLLVLAGAVAAFAPAAAQNAAALAKASGGLWEISGMPGAGSPLRQCVADVAALAQVEHRGRHCTRTVISDRPTSATIHYSCGGSDFGESDIELITPRSLRISTQGISANLPFNYVIQARRVGDCSKSTAPSRH